MAIDGVSAKTTYLSSTVIGMKSQLEDLQRQISTGKVSETYAGQGIDRTLGVSLRSQIAGYEAYASTATNVNTRIGVANLSLQSLVNVATQVKSSTNNANLTIGSGGQTSGQTSALGAFSQMISALNVQSGDRYLFSGQATDQPATETSEVILYGNGAQAGLQQVMAERKIADLGTTGMGRLAVTSPTATSVSVAEDGSAFGLKLNSVSSNLTGATVTGPTGTPPAVSVDLTANPNAGEKISFTFDLPDGTSESFSLTATTESPAPAGSFTIGATAADTAANMQTALSSSVSKLANTSLVAASAMQASNEFFDSPPQRVAGPPFDTATTLVAGTAANTVMWYTGEDNGGSARATATAQVDQGVSVQYGIRANEDAIKNQIKAVAAYALMTATPGDTNANAQLAELNERVSQQLSSQPGKPSVEEIQADLAGAQSTIKSATTRQTQAKAMAQSMLDGIENVDANEAITKFLALQTSLSASYQTTAMLYQISLTKYLPI